MRFAPRCALAGDLLLSVATKVGKSAFYRRQLFEILVGRAWGLGVWHRTSITDLLVRAECSPGLRVTNGFRLRWLSERGRGDRARTGLSGDAEVGSRVGR